MNAQPFTILIVSPDRVLVRRLSRFLEAFGYGLAQAADAPQALAAAQAGHADFLVIDDAGSRTANLQLCRQIRQLSPHAYSFALWLTAEPEVGRLTEALEAGFDDFLAKPVVYGELLARLRAGARVIAFERRLAEQSGLDAATGLPDKAALLIEVRNRLQSGTPGGWLAILDLDYFTRIQKQHGQPASQALLRGAAQLVRGQCGEAVLVAGWDADRLAVLHPATDSAAATAWGESLLARLAGHEFTVGTQPVRLTASCGLSPIAAGDTTEAILGRAERALALAKSSGRNCAVASDELARDTQDWAAVAGEGQLLATTTARDVMLPCAMVLNIDETLEQAQALVDLTRLAAIPVVDGEGRLAGLVTPQQLEAARSRSSKPHGASSVRLVRHVMITDVQRFEEATPLAELMEFFTDGSAPLAVVVREKQPRGIVHCQGLAALNERLSAGHFVAAAPPAGTSEDLLVPDLALAE